MKVMGQNNDEKLLKALIREGEEDYWFKDFRSDDFHSIDKDNYESFILFNQWRNREKTFLSNWYPKMERKYYKYFLKDVYKNKTFKEIKEELGRILPGYIIHAPIGFSEVFEEFLNRYQLDKYYELLLVFLTQVKLYYERNLNVLQSSDYVRIHKEYKVELRQLEKVKTMLSDVQEVKIVFRKETTIKFTNQLTIRKHLFEVFKKANTEFSIYESRNHEIFNYNSPKKYATSSLAKNVAQPLNRFLRTEASHLSSSESNKVIDCIAEFINLTQIPIYDKSGRIIEIIEENGGISSADDIKKKIRNWLE